MLEVIKGFKIEGYERFKEIHTTLSLEPSCSSSWPLHWTIQR